MAGIGQMHLGAVKIVNLKASTIDKEKSDPKDNYYEFKKKAYIDYSGKKSPRPQHYVTWCRDTSHDLAMWRAQFGFVPVNPEDGLYWPEGASVGAGNRYVFGDVVLVQTDLIRHLRRKLAEKKMSERAAQEKLDTYQNELDKHGAAVPQEIVDKIIN